jgi:UDP-glucose:(glucosyl)LPS alpha-1,2-glucosyltransferase
MSSAAPTTVAVVLPPLEGFGPRRARGIGLSVRHHALATSGHRSVVFGGPQEGPVFLDVTFRLVNTASIPGLVRIPYVIGLRRALRRLRPVMIEVHADPAIALWMRRLFPSIPVALALYEEPAAHRLTRTPARRSRLFRRLARVMMVSEWLRDRYLEGIDLPRRAPVVVPPCVDLGRLPVSGSGLDARGIDLAKRRTRLVLFVGRLIAEKGADRFVAACTSALASLPGWRAEIIGASEHIAASPDTPFIRLLKASAEPAGISMMGYRDHPDVMAAMARAAIVVIPGLAPDPSGRTALEAMANGAAVICVPGGALAEIGDGAAVFVDPPELAATIRALGSDPRRIADLGASGRQRAELFDLPIIGRLVDGLRARIVAMTDD